MTLDTRMGYNTPDEGLVQPSPSQTRGRKGVSSEPQKVKLEKRKAMLNIDRMTWYPNWRDLANNFLPYRGRFMVNDAWDTNKGWRRNWNIVDSTPLMANNILRNGMQSGTCSQARAWFEYKLTEQTEQLEQEPGVKEWLAQATKVARGVLMRSNFYQAVNECFGEYGVFGIGALGREWTLPAAGEEDIPHFQPYTIGSYYIAQDRKRRVNTWFRDYRWTVDQIVTKFVIRKEDGTFDPKDEGAWKNISRYVRGLWNQGFYDQWISLVHAVEENPEYKPGALGWRGMRFRSVTYERGGEPDRLLADTARGGRPTTLKGTVDAGKVASGEHKKGLNEAEQAEMHQTLKTGGFRSFPVWCFRWYTNSEDAWGRGPAMDCLGDARALQLQQKRKAQAIDKHVDPPMVANPNLRNQRTSLLPGDVTYVAPDGQNAVGFQPAYTIKPEIEQIASDIKEIQGRVNAVMHADIFQLFIQADKTDIGGQKMTAAQVNASQQEKLLMLGPVLGQMNYDLFNPLHDWLFAQCFMHGLFPPVPDALRHGKIMVKYTSIMAQAIDAMQVDAIERLTGYVLEVGQLEQMENNPVLDKFDADKAIERYAEAVGAPAELIRPDDQVQQIRSERAQAQAQAAQQEQQQQQAAALAQHAKAANLASQTPAPGGGQGSMLDHIAQAAGAGQVPG